MDLGAFRAGGPNKEKAMSQIDPYRWLDQKHFPDYQLHAGVVETNRAFMHRMWDMVGKSGCEQGDLSRLVFLFDSLLKKSFDLSYELKRRLRDPTGTPGGTGEERSDEGEALPGG